MEVILLENIRNVGAMGEKVTVKPGFGRNFLIPQGKATAATAANLKHFEARRAEFEEKAKQVKDAAQARADALAAVTVSIRAKASDEGKLFGSVGVREVADAMTAAGQELSKSEVLMPEGPIRELGEFEVGLQLHSDVNSLIKVVVVAED